MKYTWFLLCLATMFLMGANSDCGGSESSGTESDDEALFEAEDDDAGDDDFFSDDDSDDDAIDDDAEDDDATPDECQTAVTYLYDVCDLHFVNGDGGVIEPEDAVARCAAGEEFFQCATDCILSAADCDAIVSCILGHCYGDDDDDDAADDDDVADDDGADDDLDDDGQDDDGDDDGDDDAVDHAPILSDAYWDPDYFYWGPECEDEPCTVLLWSICDPDGDLDGGGLYIYAAGSNDPFFTEQPLLWSDMDIDSYDITDCDNPAQLGIGILIGQFGYYDEIMLACDMEATDDAGNLSDRINDIELIINYDDQETGLAMECPDIDEWVIGDVIEVPMMIYNSPEISQYGFTISFDHSALSFSDAATDSTLLEGMGPWAANCVLEGSGDLGCSGNLSTPLSEGSTGTFLLLRFTVTAPPDDTAFTPYNLNGDLAGIDAEGCTS